MSLLAQHAAMLQAGSAGPGLWTPADLGTAVQLWFDDDSAITLASGLAAQWNDQSANGWHITQPSATYQPLVVSSGLNGRRIFRATGDDYMSLATGAKSLFSAASSGWLFGVLKKGNNDLASTSRRVFVFTNNAAAARFGLYWDDGTSGAQNRIVVGARRLDGGTYNRLASSATSAGAWVMVLAAVDWSARTIKLYINGELDAAATSAFDASGLTSATASANADIYGLPYWAGDNAALLAGRTLPDADQIDQLFGYYAHRYALTGLLAGDHPYKASPPVQS